MDGEMAIDEIVSQKVYIEDLGTEILSVGRYQQY